MIYNISLLRSDYMKKMHKQTYIDILKSNNKLLQCAKDEVSLELDNNLKIELVCLYFFINSHNKCIPQFQDLITYNFYFYKKDLYINNIKTDINHIIREILKEELLKPIPTNGIRFVPRTIKTTEETSKKKNIDFIEVRKKYCATMRNSLYTDGRITEETISFVNSTKNNFKALINNTIIQLLKNNNTSGIESVHLEFIYGIINILINTQYNKSLPIERLLLSRNKIGVIKGLYEEKDIKSLEVEYDETAKEKEKQQQQRYYIENYEEEREDLLRIISQKIELLEQRQYYLNMEIFRLKNQPKTFNNIVFSSIIKALKESNIEFRDENKDPFINIFTQSKDIIENIFEMKLTTFTSLLDNDEIIKMYEESSMSLKLVD